MSAEPAGGGSLGVALAASLLMGAQGGVLVVGSFVGASPGATLQRDAILLAFVGLLVAVGGVLLLTSRRVPASARPGLLLAAGAGAVFLLGMLWLALTVAVRSPLHDGTSVGMRFLYWFAIASCAPALACWLVARRAPEPAPALALFGATVIALGAPLLLAGAWIATAAPDLVVAAAARPQSHTVRYHTPGLEVALVVAAVALLALARRKR